MFNDYCHIVSFLLEQQRGGAYMSVIPLFFFIFILVKCKTNNNIFVIDLFVIIFYFYT